MREITEVGEIHRQRFYFPGRYDPDDRSLLKHGVRPAYRWETMVVFLMGIYPVEAVFNQEDTIRNVHLSKSFRSSDD